MRAPVVIMVVLVVSISQETAGMLAQMERGFEVAEIGIGSLVTISTATVLSISSITVIFVSAIAGLLLLRSVRAEKGVFAGVLLLVFFVPDEGPTVNEVINQVVNDVALQADADIRPAHSRALGAVELVVLPVVHILEVINTSIVVVLTGENDVVQVAGMSVGDWVTVGVPSSEAC